MKISTSQFKNGLKIIISGQPCSIIEHEFHKPGKGQAVMRVKFRNLMTDKVIDKTYKSGESVEEETPGRSRFVAILSRPLSDYPPTATWQ